MREVTGEKYRIPDRIVALLPYILFLTCMIIVISLKSNYHVDEMSSYGLSNHYEGITIGIEDGVRYEPPSLPFEDFLTVDEQHRFCYKAVWENQASDVHPPLYYAILHTICSLFPNRFSKWYAGIINIVYAMATLLLFQKLLKCYFDNELIIEILSVGFSISAGILSNVVFLRMYVMAMFWVTAISYLYVSRMDQKPMDVKFYCKLFFVILSGALTHYYCIVFSVLISFTFFAYQLSEKNYRSLLPLIYSALSAGYFSYMIFPSMIRHMFFGYRGTKSLDNLFNVHDYWNRVKLFYGFVNNQVFGGLLNIITVIVFVLPFIYYVKSKNLPENTFSGLKFKILNKYTLLIIPIVICFLLISKMATGNSERYLFPIYAVSFLITASLLINGLSLVVFQRKGTLPALIAVVLISIGSLHNATMEFLFLDSKDFLNKAAQKAEMDCICIYDKKFQLKSMYLEAVQYHSITFVNMENEDQMERLTCYNDKPFVLSLVGIDEHNRYIDLFLEESEGLSEFQKIGSHSYGTSYFLE